MFLAGIQTGHKKMENKKPEYKKIDYLLKKSYSSLPGLRDRLLKEKCDRNALQKESILKLIYIEDNAEINASSLYNYLTDLRTTNEIDKNILFKSREEFQSAVMELKFEGLVTILDEKIKLTGLGMKKANETK